MVLDEPALEAEDLSEGRGIIRGRNGRPPTKVTTVLRKLEVLAEVSYVPLEGRVDARAARQSVRALQPREVIVLGGKVLDKNAENSKGVVNGSQTTTTTRTTTGNDGPANEPIKVIDEVSLLSDAVKTHSTAKKAALTPSDGETAELDIGHSAYPVRLIDTPYGGHAPGGAGNDGMAGEPEELFEARLGDCTVSRLDFVATGKKVALDGSIVLAPKGTDSSLFPARQPAQNSSIYLSAGDVLLTDLRAEMIAQGMKADYR